MVGVLLVLVWSCAGFAALVLVCGVWLFFLGVLLGSGCLVGGLFVFCVFYGCVCFGRLGVCGCFFVGVVWRVCCGVFLLWVFFRGLVDLWASALVLVWTFGGGVSYVVAFFLCSFIYIFCEYYL